MSASLALQMVREIAKDPDALEFLRKLTSTESVASTRPAADRRLAYSVKSLSEQTGVSPKSIRGAIHRGELQAIRRGSIRGPFLIADKHAHAWLSSRATTETGKASSRRSPPPGGVMAAALSALSEPDQ